MARRNKSTTPDNSQTEESAQARQTREGRPPRARKPEAAPKAPEAPDLKPTDELESNPWSRFVDAPKGDREIHEIISRQDAYARFRCAPKVAGQVVDPETITPGKYELCAYCLDKAERPADATPAVELRTPRARRAQTEQAPEPEPMFTAEAQAIIDQAQGLVSRIVEAASAPDARALYDALMAGALALRPVLPKARRVRTANGGSVVRAARGAYGVQPSMAGDTPEVAEIRQYAQAGDRRAQDIIAHIDAYVEGQDCSYCASKGKPGNRHRRTGFMSAGREIDGMRARKLRADEPAPAPAQAPAAEAEAPKGRKARQPKAQAPAQEQPQAEAPAQPKAGKRDRRGRPPRQEQAPTPAQAQDDPARLSGTELRRARKAAQAAQDAPQAPAQASLPEVQPAAEAPAQAAQDATSEAPDEPAMPTLIVDDPEVAAGLADHFSGASAQPEPQDAPQPGK